MKIMISHIPNTFNFGSAMMAINFIYYLNKESKKSIEFYTDARTKEDLENLINWTGLKNIKANHILPDKSKYENSKSLNLNINWVDEYCDGIIDYYDYFVVLGGDDLSEYYSREIIVNELYKLDKISKYIPVMLIGQTIGPFTGWRKEYATKKLEKCRIYTRDFLTYNYLIKELELKEIEQSADLAFLDLPMQQEYESTKLLKNYDLEKHEYITIIPSGLFKHYTDDLENYISNWKGVMEYLINNYDYDIVLLPHVLRPEKFDDRFIIENLLKEISEKHKDRIVYIKDNLSPLTARNILGNSKFSITGRMHGAVSTFQMGKPAISLSYSVKYKGVIGEGLNCDDLIIECDSSEKWSNFQVKDEIIKKINYVDQNYSKLLPNILNNTQLCKNRSLSTLEDIYSEIIVK